MKNDNNKDNNNKKDKEKDKDKANNNDKEQGPQPINERGFVFLAYFPGSCPIAPAHSWPGRARREDFPPPPPTPKSASVSVSVSIYIYIKYIDKINE